MTSYAQSLLDYICKFGNRDEVAATAFCDEFLHPLWRMLDRPPEVPVVIIEEVADSDE